MGERGVSLGLENALRMVSKRARYLAVDYLWCSLDDLLIRSREFIEVDLGSKHARR